MASTFTPNIQLEEPARGDQVGVWDTPVNNNMTLIDLVAGAITTISLNNSPVVLSAAQFKSKQITFNSTLTGSVVITFPSTFTKSYEIYNTCTGSSAFTITLQTTVAGREIICAPPGECVHVNNNGADLRYVNLGRIGSYWDYAGSSVPAWVSGCTVQPYLNCDGSIFSAGLYPALNTILGGNTLPDARGRFRANLNQTTGRLTSSQGGLDGNTLFAGAGSQTVTIGTSNLPAYTPAGTAVTTDSVAHGPTVGSAVGGGTQTTTGSPGGVYSTLTSSFTGTAQGGVSFPVSEIPPAYVGGITMIRAA